MEEKKKKDDSTLAALIGDRDKRAIALSYEPQSGAPKVIAKGEGHLAKRIIEQAREYDIPVHEDEKLANALSNIELGEFIPPELYEVVAEVLVYVDDMERIRAKLY